MGEAGLVCMVLVTFGSAGLHVLESAVNGLSNGEARVVCMVLCASDSAGLHVS
jgi:hypothetical protein